MECLTVDIPIILIGGDKSIYLSIIHPIYSYVNSSVTIKHGSGWVQSIHRWLCSILQTRYTKPKTHFLSHVNFFLKSAIQEGIINIRLLKEVNVASQGEDKTNHYSFDDGKGFI